MRSMTLAISTSTKGVLGIAFAWATTTKDTQASAWLAQMHRAFNSTFQRVLLIATLWFPAACVSG